MSFQCRTRLCWWCKSKLLLKFCNLQRFNAARGFVGGASMKSTSGSLTVSFQCRTRLCWWCKSTLNSLKNEYIVSMPHAALLVVQESGSSLIIKEKQSFNAARGFVGGARKIAAEDHKELEEFQCRTRLCWWCKSIARSPCVSCVQRLFWKVAGCLSCQTENVKTNVPI